VRSSSIAIKANRSALALACIALLAVPASVIAKPRPQGLHVASLGCINGNSDVAARRGCVKLAGARPEGDSTGLSGVVAMLAGSEGKSLYAVGNSSSILTRLALGPSSGRILFGSCFTGNSFVDECANLPGAQANAHQSPLANPTDAEISPDGRFLYVTSGDFHGATVARFSRDPFSGELTYIDCLTGELETGPAGSGACALIPSATKIGYGSGLDEPTGLAIAPDGTRVYVTAGLDQSVVTFARDNATGALAFSSCISSNRKATACSQIPGQVLDEATAPLLSADGKSLYVLGRRAGTVDTFAVAGGGEISYRGCFTAVPDERHPCKHGKGAVGGGYTLGAPAKMIESPDGRFLYVSSSYGSIVVLERKRSNGALSPSSCISGFKEDRGKCALVPLPSRLATGSPLNGVRALLLSPNGKTIFAAARSMDGITKLRRDPRSGALTFVGCATGDVAQSTAGKGVCSKLPGATEEEGVDSGFDKTTELVRGPGDLVYAAASRDSTVSILRPR
jgi:6-phosphogluconolactonase (cycloisomerase 2 family)